MDQDFIASLELTGVGMLAVIVALLLIALVIMLLSKLKSEQTEEGSKATDKTEQPKAEPSVGIQADEAAAIALAIALQRQRQKGGLGRKIEYTDTEVIGEVINIVDIDTGSGAWAVAGRLQSTR